MQIERAVAGGKVTRRPTQPEALAKAAAAALLEGDAHSALQLADCRLGHRGAGIQARTLLVRAGALQRLGEGQLADQAIDRARRIEPLDINVLALALDDVRPDRALPAARALLAMEACPFALRRRALSVLLAVVPIVADLHRRQDWLYGWVYWRPGAPLHVRLCGQDRSSVVRLQTDPRHPLSTDAHVARLSLDLTEAGLTHLELVAAPTETPSLTLGPFVAWAGRQASGPESAAPPSRAALVIVPVYDDADATNACLEHLLAQQDAPFPWRALIVNDASPREAVRAVLDAYRHEPRFEVLTNPYNLGFSASINQALRRRAPGEDVLLLNADAFLPAGALERLSVAAWSAEDIGTVTPLSNNGEQCSVPIKNQENPISAPEEIIPMDVAAFKACGHNVVDMPNGVGYCLYIKHNVVDQVGFLSDDFGRGYYEDVDYCLRVRRSGYRNVCAVGIIVGHLGSRSFQTEKNDLVHRNLKLLEARYPGYRLEFAAFLERDSLSRWRRAIARAMPAPSADVLLVADEDAVLHLLEARARHLRALGLSAVILIVSASHALARLRPAGSTTAEGVDFDLAEDASALRAYLAAMSLTRIEAASEVVDAPALSALFTTLDVSIDLLVLDARPAFRRLIESRRARVAGAGQAKDPPDQLALTVAGVPAPRLRALNTLTFRYGAGEAGSWLRVPREAEGDGTATFRPGGDRPAVLMPLWTGGAQKLTRQLAEEFRRRALPPLLLLAPLMASAPLLRMGNVVPIPYQDATELDQALRLHAVKAVIFPYRSMLPEPEHDIVLRHGTACAFFDFSGRFYSGRQRDCRLPTSWSDGLCATRVAVWFEKLL